MPILLIKTAFLLSAAFVPQHFFNRTSDLVANLTGVPERYVMVIMEHSLGGSFGRSANQPFLYAELQCFGGVPEPSRAAAALTRLFEQELKVCGTRTYIKFVNLAPADLALNGTMFA